MTTVTTTEGWISRLLGSIKSVLVGILLFLVSFPLLFWNEGRAVQTAKSLEEGAGAVVSATSESVDQNLEGKLVHLTGKAITEEIVSDKIFGVSANCIKLIRTVEMYQWKERTETTTEKNMGGTKSTRKKYYYDKEWSAQRHDSSRFQEKSGHENPQMAYKSDTFLASNVMLGAYTLPTMLVRSIRQSVALPVTDEILERLPNSLQGKTRNQAGHLYVGATPNTPQIGDLRIQFETVNPADVSIVAQQIGTTLGAYQTKAGDTIADLRMGILSADVMFKQMQAENAQLTWILRVVGFFLMTIGIGMVFNPLAVFADVIPFAGDLLRGGIALFAGVIGLLLSSLTIGIAWIAYRPLLGIGVITIGVVIAIVAKKGLGKSEPDAFADAAS